MKLSARNTLKGEVISIQPGAVNAIVIIELPDGQLVTSSISIQALKDLDLRVGQQAYAVVKAKRGTLTSQGPPLPIPPVFVAARRRAW